MYNSKIACKINHFPRYYINYAQKLVLFKAIRYICNARKYNKDLFFA